MAAHETSLTAPAHPAPGSRPGSTPETAAAGLPPRPAGAKLRPPRAASHMKFTLIDRVLEQDEQRIVALKAVTAAEEYLGDHFPGFPVLPGVMMLETLVQAARTLMRRVEGPPHAGPLVVSEVRNLRYAAMVRPGQSLKVEVTLRKRDDDGGIEFQGLGTVDDQIAVQGRFRLAPLAQD